MKYASRSMLYGSVATWVASWLAIPLLIFAVVAHLNGRAAARTTNASSERLTSALSSRQSQASAVATIETSSGSDSTSQVSQSRVQAQTSSQMRSAGPAVRAPRTESAAPDRLTGARNVQITQLDAYFRAHNDGVVYAAAYDRLLGVFNGYGTGDWELKLDDNMSRAQAATIVANTFGLQRTNARNTPRFTDVSPQDTHAYNIYALLENDVTSGCMVDPLRYCPANSITRRQFAIFVAHAIEQRDPALAASFASGDRQADYYDVPSNATGYREVRILQNLRLLEHCEINGWIVKFCPDAPLKRGEAARILARYYLYYR